MMTAPSGPSGSVTELSRRTSLSRLVNMERERTRRLSRTIERDLRRAGGKSLAVDEGEVEDPTRWRRAAVMAAHRLGHRAETYRWLGQWNVDLDYPVTKAESQFAADVIGTLLLGARTER